VGMKPIAFPGASMTARNEITRHRQSLDYEAPPAILGFGCPEALQFTDVPYIRKDCYRSVSGVENSDELRAEERVSRGN
jgi:hypothetical protein